MTCSSVFRPLIFLLVQGIEPTTPWAQGCLSNLLSHDYLCFLHVCTVAFSPFQLNSGAVSSLLWFVPPGMHLGMGTEQSVQEPLNVVVSVRF